MAPAIFVYARHPHGEHLGLTLPLLRLSCNQAGLRLRALPMQEQAQLAAQRTQGMPPIRVVAEMPESDRWGAVSVELPFEGVNDMLGVQLDRSIAQGVQIDM